MFPVIIVSLRLKSDQGSTLGGTLLCLGMGQKQLPDIEVKRAAERHSGRSHAERGNERLIVCAFRMASIVGRRTGRTRSSGTAFPRGLGRRVLGWSQFGKLIRACSLVHRHGIEAVCRGRVPQPSNVMLA